MWRRERSRELGIIRGVNSLCKGTEGKEVIVGNGLLAKGFKLNM